MDGDPTAPPAPQWISEADVVAAVPLVDAVGAVRAVLAAQHAGAATALDKTAARFAGSSTLHALGGVDVGAGRAAVKSWAHTPGGATPLLVIWDAATGDRLGVVEAFALGQLRTAAVSAVAIDALAGPGADVLAMIGTGHQALAQVAAASSVRPLREVRVHSPTADHRRRFAAEVARRLPAVEVVDCPSVAAAAEGAAVVTTATRATEPILEREMLAADVAVVALGAITPERRELAPALVRGAARVVSDSPEAATALSVELAAAAEVVALSDVVGGAWPPVPGVTVFKAMGLGLADVAVGALALERVRAGGGGRRLPRPERVAPRLFDHLAAPAPRNGGAP